MTSAVATKKRASSLSRAVSAQILVGNSSDANKATLERRVANEVGINVQRLRKLCAGEAEMTLSELEKLAKRNGYTPGGFIGMALRKANST